MEIDMNKNIVFSQVKKSFIAIAFNTVCKNDKFEEPEFEIVDLACSVKGSKIRPKMPVKRAVEAMEQTSCIVTSAPMEAITSSSISKPVIVPSTTKVVLATTPATSTTTNSVSENMTFENNHIQPKSTGCFEPLNGLEIVRKNSWYDAPSQSFKAASKLFIGSLKDRHAANIRLIYSKPLIAIKTWNANFEQITEYNIKITPPSYGFNDHMQLSIIASGSASLDGVEIIAQMCEHLEDENVFYYGDGSEIEIQQEADEQVVMEPTSATQKSAKSGQNDMFQAYSNIFKSASNSATQSASPSKSVELPQNYTWSPANTKRSSCPAKTVPFLSTLKNTVPDKKAPSAKYKYNLHELLHKSILFYDAQRAGYLRNASITDKSKSYRINWRLDSFLNDGCDVNLDLSRGWFDAGDYVKFNLPQAFSVTVLSWGLLEFKNSYISSGEYENMLNSLEHPLHYLANCVISEKEIIAQVGSGVADHKEWVSTTFWNGKRRKSYKLTRGSDVAGEMAAALAAGSLVYKHAGSLDFSQMLLEKAIIAYKFADRTKAKYSDSLYDVHAFYKSWSGYGDELIWGSAWLYKATEDENYLTKAKSYYQQYRMNGRPTLFDWDDKRGGCQLILAQITGESQYWREVNTYLSWLQKSARKTPKGMVWLSEWGSNRHVGNVAAFASIAAKHTKSNADRGKWSEWAKKQLYLLAGDQGRSFIVGFGTNPPKKPHHRSSSCSLTSPQSCSWSNLNSQQSNQIILYGALVGGPSVSGQYVDDRKDYKKNEVAIDYNAGFQTSIAGVMHFIDQGLVRGMR